METKVVRMVQTTSNKWRIETKKGLILQDEIVALSVEAAKLYVSNYISSFQAWDYEIILLED